MSSKSASPPRRLALGVALIRALALHRSPPASSSAAARDSSSDESASPAPAAAPPERAPHRLPAHPQRRPHREGPGLARGGPARHEITWVKFDSGADVNTAVIAGSIDIGLAGSSPVAAGLSEPMNIPYKVPWIHDVIGAAESLIVKNDAGVTRRRGPRGQEGRHAVRLDRALQPPRRARGRRRRPDQGQDRRPAAAGHPRRLAAWRHRRRLRVEPDARRPQEGRHRARHQRRARRAGQAHRRPLRSSPTSSPTSTRTPCRPGSTSRTRPSSSTGPTRRPPARPWAASSTSPPTRRSPR